MFGRLVPLDPIYPSLFPAFHSVAVATYYMDVRFPGFIASGSLLALTLACGCDRGAPPQTLTSSPRTSR